ncbi:MAG: hypothetical protein KY476_18890 [Planctomycetes bacterium]|nr:hypothetical protein [Planctomycetota bacterium]
MTTLPRRPPRRRPEQPGRRTATLLALVFLIAASVMLLFLVANVLPQFAGLVAVVAGLFSFGALHYLLWGFWLSNMHPPDTDAERNDESRD